MTVKSSILIFYLTVTQGEKVFRWANYITLFVVNVAGTALTLVNVFQCKPIGAAFAYPRQDNADCTDVLTLYLSSSPVNIITDLAILFIPNPIVTQMRLPRKQKFILVITFSFGFFVAVVDVIRIAYLQDAATSRQLAMKDLHLQYSQGDDINCTWPSQSSMLPSSDSSRVRVSVVHVVRRRGQCVHDLRLRTDSQALGRSPRSQIDQGLGYKLRWYRRPAPGTGPGTAGDGRGGRNAPLPDLPDFHLRVLADGGQPPETIPVDEPWQCQPPHLRYHGNRYA